jgi:hypothetical protein
VTALDAVVMDAVAACDEGAVDDVLVALTQLVGEMPAREEFEASVNRLLHARLVTRRRDGFALTDAGQAAWKRVRRAVGDARDRRMEKELRDIPPAGRSRQWHVPADRWATAVALNREFRRRNVANRLHIVDAYLRAIDMFDNINDAVRAAADGGAAYEALMRAPFGFTEIQARHVLDMQVRRQTVASRTALNDERTELLAELAALGN